MIRGVCLGRIISLILFCALLFWTKEGRGDGENGAARPAGAGANISQSSVDVCLRDTDCARLANRARAMSSAREYEAALVAYQAAYALRPAPWLLVNIGRVNQKLGRLQEAIRSYRDFLARDDRAEESDTRSRAKAFLAEAESELVRQQPEPTSVEEPEPPPAPLLAPPTHPAAASTAMVPDRSAGTRTTSLAIVKPDTPRPVYKRPWFIGLMSASAGAVSIGIAVGLSTPHLFDRPNTILYPTKQ